MTRWPRTVRQEARITISVSGWLHGEMVRGPGGGGEDSAVSLTGSSERLTLRMGFGRQLLAWRLVVKDDIQE